MSNKSTENIDKSIEQLINLKKVLRKKLSNVDVQIQQQRMKKAKLKHLQTMKEYFAY